MHDMDLHVFARDTTGLYRILKLAKRTGAGHVIQALPGAGDSGLHRTWHADGYVHDRSTIPPSITSTGNIQPPQTATDECFARHDLVAGRLSETFAAVSTSPRPGALVVELTDATPGQRLEVWYTQPARVLTLRSGSAAPPRASLRSGT
jgi:hypothetical protein